MALKILVTGAAAGLGLLIADALNDAGHHVYLIDKEFGSDVRFVGRLQLPPEVDVLINCAGVNKIAWLPDVTDELWDETMEVNVKSIMKMTQRLLPQLKASRGTVINIVSNAAHMPMRCSAAYNASKGAALILTKQLARELIDDGITVFSISPNKLKGTKMSDSIDKQVCGTRGWTVEQAQEYQLKGLLTGKETDPARLAEFITFLLGDKARHEHFAGCDIQYGL